MITLLDRKTNYAVKLIDTQSVSHDTKIFRFALPSDNHILGHSVGQNVHVIARPKNQILVRHYDIITLPETKGYFDILVKIYSKTEQFPEGGKMTLFLDGLQKGDSVEIRGPSGPNAYEGRGLFAIKTEKKAPKMPFVAKKLGLIAGGAGISAFVAILRAIFNDDNDKTVVSIILANKTEKDILLRDELENMAKMKPNQFKVWHTLSREVPEGWPYSKGHVTVEMISQHIPPAADDVLTMVCGPDNMIASTSALLQTAGHLKKSIVECY